MGKINNAIFELHEIDEMAARKIRINRIHPLAKLMVTFLYIVCVLSYDKYNLSGLLPMAIYPLVLFNLSELSIGRCFKKLRLLLPLVCFIGLFNPIYDKTPLYHLGSLTITGGMISLITLVVKGIYALTASFLLIATTGIERICYALKLLHVPQILVTQILLTYRYLTLLLSEANAVYQAYSLRAPKEKGVRYKIWGSLIGQLLLRSIDRAGNLYDSMLLRGFCGEFYYADKQRSNGMDYSYLVLWIVIITLLRAFNIADYISALV